MSLFTSTVTPVQLSGGSEKRDPPYAPCALLPSGLQSKERVGWMSLFTSTVTPVLSVWWIGEA